MSWAAVAGAAVSVVGGALTSSGSSAPKPPKYMRTANKRLIRGATEAADRPYEAYTGPRVAGLSGLEGQAGELAGTLSSRYQPMIQRAGAAFDPAQLKQFENPYMESVVQGRLSDVGRAYDTQLGGLNRKRGMMDAFGTDRGSMLETALMRERGREMDRISNEGRAASYQSALDALFRDKQSALSAAQAGGNIDQGAVNSMLEAGGRARSVEQAQADFDYGQFLERRDWSVNNLEPLMKAMGTAQGSGGPTASTAPNYGTLLSGLGTTLAGVIAQGGSGGGTITGTWNPGGSATLPSGGTIAAPNLPLIGG